MASVKVACVCSHKREAPRDKLVASRSEWRSFSHKREAPRDKLVASRSEWRSFSHKREAPRGKLVASRKANSSLHDQCAQGCLSSWMRLGNI